MPLKRPADKGTEQDGRLSQRYCAMCYENGAFIDPAATPEKMQAIADKALREKHFPRLLRYFALRQIPNLERWKK